MTEDGPNTRIHGSRRADAEFVPHSALYQGRFGRMFRELPGAHDPNPHGDDWNALRLLAAGMREPDDEPDDDDAKQDHWAQQADPKEAEDRINNPCLPAGYTYFGQFVDHDITFDPTSSLQRANDPDALDNFRTPRFDLDSLYGRGPADDPFMYEADGPFAGVRFLIGRNPETNAGWRAEGAEEETYEGADLPRNQGPQGRALIGDPRNDENTVVSQLQLAMLRVHNAFVRHLTEGDGRDPGRDVFEDARRLTRWHYQWAVINDFLTRLAGGDVVADILGNATTKGEGEDGKTAWQYRAPGSGKASKGGRDCEVQAQVVKPGRPRDGLRFFRWKHQPYMPVEFSGAAYRFGHSLVRPAYQLNGVTDPAFFPIFKPGATRQREDLRGFRRLPSDWSIDWSRFFDDAGGQGDPQFTRRIDQLLAPALFTLPGLTPASLAERNLIRGAALGLPSGQAVSRFMGLDPDDAAGPDGNGTMADLTQHLEGLELTGLPDDLDPDGQGDMAKRFGTSTPLWYYVLAEAQGATEGLALGPVGGRIVAEVLCGLVIADPSSHLQLDPTWKPELNVLGEVALDENLTVGTLMRVAEAERQREPDV